MPNDQIDVMQCIICMQAKAVRTGVGEHIIPRAMGGSFTIDRVCVDCDSRMGATADAGLINLFVIEKRRAQLRLTGNAGVAPDPLKRNYKGPLTDVEDARHKIVLRRDRKTGAVIPKTLSRVEFDVQHVAGGTLIRPVGVFVDPSEEHRAEELARKALRKAGLTNELTINDYAKRFSESLFTVESMSVFSGRQEIRVGGHREGLLKIAYEFAWYWLGNAWLDDSIAKSMRAILNGEEPESTVMCAFPDDPSVGVIAVEGDQSVVHIVDIHEQSGRLLVVVRLFDLLTASFEVAANSASYQVPAKNAVVMHTLERKFEETVFGRVDPGAV